MNVLCEYGNAESGCDVGGDMQTHSSRITEKATITLIDAGPVASVRQLRWGRRADRLDWCADRATTELSQSMLRAVANALRELALTEQPPNASVIALDVALESLMLQASTGRIELATIRRIAATFRAVTRADRKVRASRQTPIWDELDNAIRLEQTSAGEFETSAREASQRCCESTPAALVRTLTIAPSAPPHLN